MKKAKAAKRCPADGMSNLEAGAALSDAFMDSAGGKNQALSAMGAKARELFSPTVPAAAEKRVPQVGDEPAKGTE